jgi:cob(I)alamin adenosyltransferase
MKIYTGRGDQGQTSLFSGERVGKHDLRVEAYGTLDELNSALGVAHTFSNSDLVRKILSDLQSSLFLAGSDLATHLNSTRSVKRMRQEDWKLLERHIDDLEVTLPALKNFILPTGSAGAALLHSARSVCRRAERLVVRLIEQEGEVNLDLLIYLNRLSDLLFVMARRENWSTGNGDTIWRSP